MGRENKKKITRRFGRFCTQNMAVSFPTTSFSCTSTEQKRSSYLVPFFTFSIFGKYGTEIEILEVELNFYAILFSNMSS